MVWCLIFEFVFYRYGECQPNPDQITGRDSSLSGLHAHV